MSSRRRSSGRIVLVAILVVIALLILELGQLLPGSWPGGGGDRGSKSFPTGGAPDPNRLAPSPTPPPPPTKSDEAGTLRIVVRRADGTPVEGGSVAFGEGSGGLSAELVEGEAILRQGGAVADEWAISLPGGARIGHGRAPSRGDGRWIVALPRRLPDPTPRATPSTNDAVVSLRVEDADGRPVDGATVTSTGPRGEHEAVTGADGTSAVPNPAGVQRFCVTAAGFGEACVYARLVPREPLVIRLSPTRSRQTRFGDPATGNLLHARSLTLIDRRGAARRLEPSERLFERFEVNMPDDLAAETTLEIDVEGRPPVRVPLSSMAATTPIPTGATRTVRMFSGAGIPVAGAIVTARFAAGSSSEHGSAAPIEMTAKTDASGQATIALPLDRDTDLVVDSPAFVTAGLRVAAETSSREAPYDIAASPGVDRIVTVTDEAGAPVSGADVIVLFPAGRLTARRRATTEATGEVTLHAIPAERVEVLVHRAGFAWESETGTVTGGAHRFSFKLRPGKRLTLVVEDAAGVPLRRVTVRSVPRATPGATATDAIDPDQTLPWETTESGVLIVEDLPDRELDLYLSKPGFDDEVVARVRPGPSTWFATMVPTAKPGAK